MITQIKRKLPQIKGKLFKKIQLNIGCGPKSEKDFIGIDVRDCGQEIIWDVRQGIPFPDNSVDMIYTSHFLEHLDNDEAEDFFRENYRVLKKGGKTAHVLPHATDPTAFYFDHKTFWNEERIDTLPGVPGLENFKIIKNQSDEEKGIRRAIRELVFVLEKT